MVDLVEQGQTTIDTSKPDRRWLRRPQSLTAYTQARHKARAIYPVLACLGAIETSRESFGDLAPKLDCARPI